MAKRMNPSKVERHKIVTATKTWLCALRWLDLLIFWILIPTVTYFVIRYCTVNVWNVPLDDPDAQKLLTEVLAASFVPGLLVFLFRLIIVKSHYVVFFDDCIIDRWGILSKYERKYIFLGVISASVDQNFFQRILSYGNAEIHVVGKTFHINHLGRPNYVLKRLRGYYIDDRDFHTAL